MPQIAMKELFKKCNRKECLFFFLLFVFSALLTIKVHHERGTFNWKSEIWADRAGYYMYLPATFFYHFDASKSPEGIDGKTGYGFTVDRQGNKFHTQYYYGVALLVSPFFLSAHVVSKVIGRDEEGGFSGIFNKFTDIAAVFYLVLGLIFLKRFLRYYFSERMQYFIVLVTFLGTNLFFYAIEDTLMSHVYSFFAVALFLYAMKEFLADQSRYRYFLLMAFAFGLMFIIRPTNCLLGLIFPFWDVMNRKEVISRIRLIFHPKYLLPLVAIMFTLMIPQMMYWKITHGTYIYLVYGAGFANWDQPKFMEVWFSTLNGLVPWSPLNLLIIAGMVYMAVKKPGNGILILFFFLLISYMAAAYKFWYFGCCYGHRAFVEFYPLLCIPLGFLSGSVFDSGKWILKAGYVLLVLLMVYMNAGLALTADKCYFGSTWDWDQYARQVERIHLYPSSAHPLTFKNDFENEAITSGSKVTDTVMHSGQWSALLDPDHEFCCEHSAMIWDFRGVYPKFVKVRFLVKKASPEPISAVLVCAFDCRDTVKNWQSQPLNGYVKNNRDWFPVIKTFKVPAGYSGDTRIKVHIWNKDKDSFFVDDLTIRYE